MAKRGDNCTSIPPGRNRTRGQNKVLCMAPCTDCMRISLSMFEGVLCDNLHTELAFLPEVPCSVAGVKHRSNCSFVYASLFSTPPLCRLLIFPTIAVKSFDLGFQPLSNCFLLSSLSLPPCIASRPLPGHLAHANLSIASMISRRTRCSASLRYCDMSSVMIR